MSKEHRTINARFYVQSVEPGSDGITVTLTTTGRYDSRQLYEMLRSREPVLLRAKIPPSRIVHLAKTPTWSLCGIGNPMDFTDNPRLTTCRLCKRTDYWVKVAAAGSPVHDKPPA